MDFPGLEGRDPEVVTSDNTPARAGEFVSMPCFCGDAHPLPLIGTTYPHEDGTMLWVWGVEVVVDEDAAGELHLATMVDRRPYPVEPANWKQYATEKAEEIQLTTLRRMALMVAGQ